MKPATKYGEEKKNTAAIRVAGAFDGRLGGVGIFDGTFYFFMIDRTGGATVLLSSLYTVLTREVPRYLCMYVPGRYGTL